MPIVYSLDHLGPVAKRTKVDRGTVSVLLRIASSSYLLMLPSTLVLITCSLILFLSSY